MSRKTRQRKNRSIPLHTLVDMAGYGSFPNRGEMIQYLASLKPRPVDVDTVTDLLIRKYGRPKEKLEMRKMDGGYQIFGIPYQDIEHGALAQIQLASRLPVFVKGALLPDAHQGCSLPIGGVAVLDNAISPRFVGADIACRMCLTIFENQFDSGLSDKRKKRLLRDIQNSTHFGQRNFVFGDERKRTHWVMNDSRWKDIKILKHLFAKASEQLGTSGGGNHFVNIMIGTVLEDHPELPPKDEHFVALMSHSGSRYAGKALGDHYAKIAEIRTRVIGNIPKFYEWLDLDTEEGQEYYEAMSLMGEYAQANHKLIHDHFLRNSGLDELVRFENHHNFAWKTSDGNVIHRKGATPAEAGTIGIIPGSSGTAAYLVEGLGNPDSVYSSSHGAGRIHSRTAAKAAYNADKVNAAYAEHDVLVHGVAKDENPYAYKDIHRVMELQRDLVKPLAVMYPKIVVMGG